MPKKKRYVHPEKTEAHSWANPAFSKAMHELNRSSAASRHTLKKYKGSRQTRKLKSIQDFEKE